MTEEIIDVIMLQTGRFRPDIEIFQANRPPEEDFYLTKEMWVAPRLPYSVPAARVFDACDSPGWNHHAPRQNGMRYAICRKVEPTHEAYYHWDSDQKIGIAVLLSRFIHPTTIGTSLAARLYFIEGELAKIVPGPTQSNCSHSWVVADDRWRDWLSIPELEQLRELLPRYIADAPTRIRLARKHIDNAFYDYFLDERFAALVSSFESLLKTSRSELTEQFRVRASNLATMLGLELSRADLHNTYGHRSDYVHGSLPQFEGLTHEVHDNHAATAHMMSDLLLRYNRCELVLRRALLRASTEPDFAQLFSSEESIEKAFGTPMPRTHEEKRLKLLNALKDEEFEAEYIRRYGSVSSFQAFK